MTDQDIIIIGGGAAGIAAAQYGARANRKTLLIEQMAVGGQALVIEGLENYPGFVEPVNGFEFSQKLEKQAKQFGAQIVTATVKSINRDGDFFTVTTSNDTYRSYTVIIATGAKHRMLNIPGEEEFSGRGVSYCATCDGPFFKGKKILVVGGGDAACDEAMYLSKLSDKITMVHRRDRFRAQKSLAERVLNNKNIEVRFNTIAAEIKGDNKVQSVVLEKTDDGSTYEEAFDAFFIFIGSIPQTALVADLPMDEAGYIETNQRMETSQPGLYAAGDVRATPFRQLVVAAGEGAIAAHAASQYIDEVQGEKYE